jgi:hypothetical protein
MVNRFTPANAALALKIVGIICILSFFVDFLFLISPFQPTDRLWLIGLLRNLVDRGVVPLVGVGFILVGSGMESSDTPSLNLKLPTFILSILLGLMFFVIAPLHVINVNQYKVQTVDRFNREANQLENQIKAQAAQVQTQLGNQQVKDALEKQKAAFKEQLAGQLNEVIKDEQRYNQALNNPSIPQPQKDLLKKYKTDPKALDDFIANQTDPQQIATQRAGQIRDQKEQRLKQTEQDAWKEVRVALSSFLLSIAFVVIGWTGLRNSGVLQGGASKRKAPAR